MLSHHCEKPRWGPNEIFIFENLTWFDEPAFSFVSLLRETVDIVSNYFGITRCYAWGRSFNSTRELCESPRNATTDRACKCCAKVWITYLPWINCHYLVYKCCRPTSCFRERDVNKHLRIYTVAKSREAER